MPAYTWKGPNVGNAGSITFDGLSFHYFEQLVCSTDGKYVYGITKNSNNATHNNSVFYSSNYGVTWTQNNLGLYVRAIACSGDGSIVYVISNIQVKIKSSTDYGVTFTDVAGNVNVTFTNIVCDATGQKINATTTSVFVVISSDGGAYLDNGNAYITNVSAILARSQNGYSVYVTDSSRQLWYSIDGGNNFPYTFNYFMDNSIYVNQLVCNSTGIGYFGNTLYAACNTGIYKSTDSGSSWTRVLTGTYTTVSCDYTGQYVLTCVAGGGNGFYLSVDYGVTFVLQTPAPFFSQTTNSSLVSGDASNFFISGIGVGFYTYTIVPCFKEGTLILCMVDGNEKYVPVEHLRKGTLVKTSLNGYLPIDMIGFSTIAHNADQDRIKDQLYLCSKYNYPDLFEDLVITGCHGILIDEFINDEQRQKTEDVNGDIYVTDKKYRLPACVDERATVYPSIGRFTVYNFALENDHYYMNYGVYANGLLVETCSKRYLKEVSNMTLIE